MTRGTQEGLVDHGLLGGIRPGDRPGNTGLRRPGDGHCTLSERLADFAHTGGDGVSTVMLNVRDPAP